jgi:hypothetical protein
MNRFLNISSFRFKENLVGLDQRIKSYGQNECGTNKRNTLYIDKARYEHICFKWENTLMTVVRGSYIEPLLFKGVALELNWHL